MEYLNKVGERVFNFVLNQTIRQVTYILRYRQIVEELSRSAKDLRGEKDKVGRLCDEAEKNLHNIEDKVTEWFKRVDESETTLKEFKTDEGHKKARLAYWVFPYLRNRHRLGRQATKMAVDVKKLIDESPKPDEVSYRQNVISNDATLSNAGFIAFGSTKSTMEDIMGQLQDSNVRMIGLYGPGGSGKSTLVKEIAKQARDNKLFNVVITVGITVTPNLQKIQGEIAYVLGLRLEVEGENARADCLRRRLKNEKENTLLILDDLWDRLDLNKLGIPLDDNDLSNYNQDLNRNMKKHGDCSSNDNQQDDKLKVLKRDKFLGDYNGCKILLTSRFKEVLSDKMDVKSTFCVKELDNKDALMLFQNVAGIPDDAMSDSKQEIVKKYCAGLPMAIVTVARALKGKSESTWKATLEKFKMPELVGVQTSMEISVKMSYDHLEDEELKSIFLICAQMGHQPLIMDLVKYCFGLGILKGVYSLEEARDRIYKSIQKLKDSGLDLVLDGSSNIHFNMHDLVRDAALSIAHKEHNVFTLRNDKLDDWPELESCTSISICNCDIIDELPQVINCSQLKFLQIDSDDPSLKIPDEFFKGMKRLRVLILSGIHLLSSLQSSVDGLSNLRMLCLERCTSVPNLSFIGKLKKLKILSFSGSQITNLPAELGELDKLQLLDISNCSIKEKIPHDLLSRLTSLEELYIRESLIKAFAQEQEETNKSQPSFLSELKHLYQLKVVDLSIPYASIFPKDLFFDKLNDYKIVIGGDFGMLSLGDFKMPNKYKAFKSLALQLKDDTDIHFQKGIKLLFKGVENLLLGELNGVNTIHELNLDGFPSLKHLSIINNNDIKHFNSMDLSYPEDVFPNLESLCLHKLRNIEMICCSPVDVALFPKLITIKVDMCDLLKNLFSFYTPAILEISEVSECNYDMVRFLSNLESIEVSECNSLKEILQIPMDYAKVEFLKLRSLTLHSLPSFTSFYTRVEESSVPHLTKAQTTNMDPPLFGERVEITNLESLNLSSINIHKIWSDRPSSSFCFQNLIKLVMKDYNKLRYLCSLSVASGLKKLKSLFISGCRGMEKIFEIEEKSADKVCVFPKLEEIHLSEMNILTNMWQAAEVSVDSFSSLISVHIDQCNKLNKIFPSDMEGWFANLDSLKVVSCKSVKVIFEINSQQMDESGGIDTNLQHILVDNLPKLKQVWSKDPGGIFNFKKLQSIQVFSCDKLRNVLSASVAKDVPKLEHMSIKWSRQIVEIVECEKRSETNNEPLVFHTLTHMELVDLPNIKHIYIGTIECPKLKRLAVKGCKKLKAFRTAIEEKKTVLWTKKVIPNLEYMEIDSDQAPKWISTKHYESKCRMHRLKELSLSSVQSVDLLCKFLYKMPNLEKLSIHSGCWLDESVQSANIAQHERLGTVLQLKELVLWSSEINDLGFEREPVLQRLELLSLYQCQYLSSLAPPSISLAYLTNLKVTYCNGLRNLMASSTAKSLVQLKSMKVIDCHNVKEIVTEEDKKTEIIFSKLITIELAELPSLTSFSSYKECEFNFPSLEVLIVRECPRMKTFTESRKIRAPKLQNILGIEGEEEAKWEWKGDVNGTIEKVFKDKVCFRYKYYLYLSGYPDLIEQLWHGNHFELQNSYFRNLKILAAYKCDSLVHVIPSHLLPCFQNLEELFVWDCKSAKVIFNTTNEMRAGMNRLKILTLKCLPKLEHVWEWDEEGNIGLQGLQDMRVHNCDCLKSLFPASAVKDITRSLQVLQVTECRELVEIISKGGAEEGATVEEFVFSSLTSLTLRKLPGLKYLYPGILHTVEEDHPEEQVLTQIKKVIQIPSLKKLSFGIGDIPVSWDRESGELQFDYKLDRFPEELDSALLNRFLDMLPTIQKVAFEGGMFLEMFSAERQNADYTKFLSHLSKGLELRNMYLLKSIDFEHSWLQPFPENLQTLQVIGCHSLKSYLVRRTVSFSNLTYLEVINCRGLPYLFTSSTAKSLGQLKKMKIKECGSLKEIVSTGGDETQEDNQIIFEQLRFLYLEELHQLRWFYPGNIALCFPTLEQVYVIDCNLMKTFSPVNKIDHSIEWFSAKYAIPQLEYSHLNSAVARSFEEKFLESARSESDLSLSDSPLQEIWYGSQPIPDSCFSNLGSLTVDGCQFLSDAVLPFNLLPFFTELETLEVRNCDNVKTIFDVKCITTQDRIMTFVLEKLTLERLPNLENVWNEDPCGILSTQQLRVVSVEKCKCLTSVFPASVAKDLVKLEELVVKNCGELMEIVAYDNANPRGTNDPCPCVRSLELEGLKSLQNMVSIASESSWIEPLLVNLETLQVISCSGLKNLVACTVSFSSLTCLEVYNCDELLYLFTSSAAKSLTQLKTMKIERCRSIEEIVSKDGDESAEDEIVFPQLNCLVLGGLPKLKRFYEGNLSFPSLDQLSVYYCDRMGILCPGTLKTDKLLEVKLKMFEDAIPLKNDLNSTMLKTFLTRSVDLSLKDSSVLQEIWHGSLQLPDSSFNKLGSLTVDGCQFLSDAVLPFHLLPFFTNLKTLEVRNCDNVKSIFDVKCRTTQDRIMTFVLKKLTLERLPNLENVWNADQKGTNLDELTFPDVKSLTLCDLPKLKYFWNTFTHLEPQLCIEKLTPNLECLTLGENELKMILHEEFQGNHLKYKLKVLTLYIEFNVFLGRVPNPNIEKLVVSDGSFKGTFPFMDEAGLLSHLKLLCLDSLSIGLEDNSRIVPFLKDLETLEVMSFLSSINLVPCTTSFSKLTYLEVERCNSLLYLFTSSTAKSLAQLKTMKITWCDSIKEIVSKEGDESNEDEIVFPQLNCLELKYLGKLRRFYKGSLSFPSLEDLWVVSCDRMEILCAGTVKTEMLLKVKFEWFVMAIPLKTDLNSAMQNR